MGEGLRLHRSDPQPRGGGGRGFPYMCPVEAKQGSGGFEQHQRREGQEPDRLPRAGRGGALLCDLVEKSCFYTGGGVGPLTPNPQCLTNSGRKPGAAKLTFPLLNSQAGRRQDTFSPQNMQNGGCHEHWDPHVA